MLTGVMSGRDGGAGAAGFHCGEVSCAAGQVSVAADRESQREELELRLPRP